MTQRLQATSPRHAAAVAFGALLDRRMREREVGQGNLRDAAGVSRASIVEYRHGRNLPSLEVALRLADALDEPRLAEIARQGRMVECPRCGRPFLNEAGLPKRYCSPGCRLLGAPSLDGQRRSHGEQAVAVLRSEFLRMGAVRKQQVGRALTLLDDAFKPVRDAEQALSAYQDAVAAMCAACEPEGLCRTAECPLRGISPLPLASARDVTVQTAVKAPGRWGQPEASERASEMLRRRWAEPGRKEEQSERALAFHAGLTEEGRAAWIAKISATKQERAEITGGGVVGRRDRVLTYAEMQDVRRARQAGRPVADLARIHGVSQRTIYRACEGSIEEGEVGGQRVVVQVVPGRQPRFIKRTLAEAIA